MDYAMAIRAEAFQVCEARASLALHFGHGDRAVVHLDASVAERPEALGRNEAAALAEEAPVQLNEASFLHSREARCALAAEMLHAPG